MKKRWAKARKLDCSSVRSEARRLFLYTEPVGLGLGVTTSSGDCKSSPSHTACIYMRHWWLLGRSERVKARHLVHDHLYCPSSRLMPVA